MQCLRAVLACGIQVRAARAEPQEDLRQALAYAASSLDDKVLDIPRSA